MGDPRNLDSVVEATRYALAVARADRKREVDPDDLLLGALHSIARFGIVTIGPLAFDLRVLDGRGTAPILPPPSDAPGPSYTPETAGIFDRAAAVAKTDGSSRIRLVHLLVALGESPGGILEDLRRVYAFDDSAWRAALVCWDRETELTRMRNGDGSAGGARERELLTPDQVADLLDVHTQTVRGYIRTGKLPAFRIAGERAIRVRHTDVMALLEPLEPEEPEIVDEED